jgi:hypothetical protein
MDRLGNGYSGALAWAGGTEIGETPRLVESSCSAGPMSSSYPPWTSALDVRV